MESVNQLKALRSLLIENESEAARNILSVIAEKVDASRIALYYLSLSSGKYKLYCYYPKGFAHELPHNFKSTIDEFDGGYCIISSKECLYPIKRKDTCIGVLSISLNNAILEDSQFQGVQDLTYLLIVIYERNFIDNMLNAVQRPIPFETVSQQQFYRHILETVQISSGMQKIALREFTPKEDLICLGVIGFGEDVDVSLFSFTRDKIPDDFLMAIMEQKHVVVEKIEGKEWVTENSLLGGIKSFVVIPIKVGTEVFGTLSFATSVEYRFSKYEISAFEGISNGIGVSIANFRNYNLAKYDVARFNENVVALTALEVAQSSRHLAKNKLDNCQNIIALLIDDSAHRIGDKLSYFDKLTHQILDAQHLIDRIKTAVKPPKKIIKSSSIKDIWNEAKAAISGRLSMIDINVTSSGKDIVLEVYPDLMRQAFILLIQNSCDAFERGKIKDKKVSLIFDRVSDEFSFFSYSDNAGGVDVGRLEYPPEYSSISNDLNQLLFERDVTSKGIKGSGWGLYLVRRAISENMGSIDLLRHRGGIAFSITLPLRIR